MIKVEAYYCEHCKKLYKTERHLCFDNPDNRACSTCKYYGGKRYYEEGGMSHAVYLCDVDGTGCEDEMYVIADTQNRYQGCGQQFHAYSGKRGYKCEWWAPRELIKEESCKSAGNNPEPDVNDEDLHYETLMTTGHY